MGPNNGDGSILIGGIGRRKADDDAVLSPRMRELLDGDTGVVHGNLQGV